MTIGNEPYKFAFKRTIHRQLSDGPGESRQFRNNRMTPSSARNPFPPRARPCRHLLSVSRWPERSRSEIPTIAGHLRSFKPRFPAIDAHEYLSGNNEAGFSRKRTRLISLSIPPPPHPVALTDLARAFIHVARCTPSTVSIVRFDSQ